MSLYTALCTITLEDIMNKSLTEIANTYGTDKGTIGPSNTWNANNYTDVYDAYLGKYRQSHINFLEIGLGVTGNSWDAQIVHGRNTGGASIKMWHDYFQNGMIYGIDINECAYLDNDRIKTHVVDQGSVEDLNSFISKSGVDEFDIIIDDGSHRPDHQQISFDFFFKKLKSGGIYIIEDLLSNGLGDGVKGRMADNSVINTRSVLASYLKDGKFSGPNAFTDLDYLHNNIELIRFHVPPVKVKYVLNKSLSRPVKKVVYFEQNKERVCVIKKK